MIPLLPDSEEEPASEAPACGATNNGAARGEVGVGAGAVPLIVFSSPPLSTRAHEMARKKDADKSAQSDQSKNSQKNEPNEDEEPSFDDPEGFTEIPDEELLADIIADRPEELDGVDSVIVVDGVPQVAPSDGETSDLSPDLRQIWQLVNEYYPKSERPPHERLHLH
ncbi:hypothetical protein GE061_006771 [Apolygus lucorum]|uniref:Uncharacterized protein n=1 Tax=Apolygus lucorum TaxID=248454 RepID=A0A8S9WRE0_APOLU|nr:hypothetical protein GE061_006771 [Apolygus lucorum]